MSVNPQFLPMTREEMDSRGWRELDVLLVTGDAYFDHPSHGAAVIGRVLERAGYRVGIVARPDWRSTEDFRRLGRPALFAGVTAGAVDSALSNRTASSSRRRTDAYAPGGAGGGRPDQATAVYANRVREAFPGLKVVLGGIEASLRRFAYFDAAKERIRRSILVDTRADILVYGPGELQVVEIAHRLAGGRELDGIPGTARLLHGASFESGSMDALLPDFEDVEENRFLLFEQNRALEMASRPGFSGRLAQRYREGTVVAETPSRCAAETLDDLWAMEYARERHPIYREAVPALETVRWSVISHRGCPGGCSFCGLAMHQGRGVVSRSPASILDEVRAISKIDGFKGTVTDIGGPTANAYGLHRLDPDACASCRRPSCLFPSICRHLDQDHGRLLDLLDVASRAPKVKRVFLASGIRHDLALKDPRFIREVARRYTGGHLKVAPEHVAPAVLRRMRKPGIDLFEAFEAVYLKESRAAGKEQYVVPYFIAGFPGCSPEEAEEVGRWLASRGQRLEQCQIFMPIAGTAASAMTASGRDEKGAPLFLPDPGESQRQKRMMTAPSKTEPRRRRKKRG